MYIRLLLIKSAAANRAPSQFSATFIFTLYLIIQLDSMELKDKKQNSIDQLRAAALSKLDALEKKHKSLLNPGATPLSRRMAFLREFVKCSTDEDSLFSAMGRIGKLESEADSRIQKLLVQCGIIQATGNKSPFSEYLLENDFPQRFIYPAFRFRDDIVEFGWKLQVDNGIVFASGQQGEFPAGFLANGAGGPALLSSEMPEWEWSGSKIRRTERQLRLKEMGADAADGFVCSIKLSGSSLGISRNSIGLFIANAISGTGDLNKMYFRHLETEYVFCGIRVELNENGTSLHIDLMPKESNSSSYDGRVRAHFI